MIETLETGITSPRCQRLRGLPRNHFAGQRKPHHSLRPIFDEYALYGLAGEAVRHRTASGAKETAEPKKFLQEENLVRIERTFEPFPEPILPPV